jgi:hypothetical protein
MGKKALLAFVIILSLFLYFIIPPFVFGESLSIVLQIGYKQARVNDTLVILDVAPLLQESRTFVPIRFIAETFGAKVSWKEDRDESGEGLIKLLFVYPNKSSMQIKMHTQIKLVMIEYLKPGDLIPDVVTQDLDSAPFVKKPENRTMVPLRFISELLQAQVTWISDLKEIRISKENIYPQATRASFAGNHPEVEWERKIKGSTSQFASFIQQTVDGGYILTGTSIQKEETKISVMKLNNQGEVLWQSYYSKNEVNYGVAIYQTSDNGYLLFGNTLSGKDQKSNIYVVKINWDGLVLWDKQIGEELDDRIYAVKPTKDQGFILCGQTESSSNQEEDAFLIKMDVSGNIEWQKIYEKQGIDLAKDCIPLEDNGFAFIGSSVNSKGIVQVLVTKTDSTGNHLWQKTFGEKGNFIGNSIVETPDKGFVLLAETDTFSSFEGIYLMKIDTFGQVLWEKYYEGSQSTIGYSIEKTNSGYYMIAGATNLSIDDLLTYSGTADAYFLFVDSYGNKVWDKILRGDKHDLLSKVIRTTDLGFMACGRTSSNDEEILTVYLVKLTPIQEDKPLLEINPLYVNFGLLEKKSTRITSFITISNNGAQNLSGYLQTDDPWILLSDKTFIIPTFGNLKVLVSINPADMEEGAYDGQISVTSNAGSQRIKILCTIVDNSPRLFVDPIKIDFKNVTMRKNITLQLSLYNLGRQNLYGSVQSDSPFIKIDPINFVSNQQKVSITLLTAKLKNGTYQELIKVQTNGGTISVPVFYQISFPVIKMVLCINNPKAEIDGKTISFDPKNPKIVPFILNGRTMVPIRFISEAFGAEVFWDSFAKKIYLKVPSKEIQIVLQVNNSSVLINQKQTKLDVPPIIFEGRVYVPIRFIAEAFGAIVSLEKNTYQESCVKIIYEK